MEGGGIALKVNSTLNEANTSTSFDRKPTKSNLDPFIKGEQND